MLLSFETKLPSIPEKKSKIRVDDLLYSDVTNERECNYTNYN